MIELDLLARLNAATDSQRLEALAEVLKDTSFPPADPRHVNNHIHTIFSFSPYSPTAAVYMSRMSGLCTAGIMDHDSISGAREFIAAGEMAGIATTVGLECRISMRGTAWENRRTNNPDQIGATYMSLHGVPHDQIETLDQYFAPRRALRNERNRKMLDRCNELLAPFGIGLDFERDILPLSQYACGGSVTERHLMMGVAQAMAAHAGRGQNLIRLLEKLDISLTDRQRETLSDTSFPFYDYDVLGILKSGLIPKVFVPADEELPTLSEISALARQTGAILCYPYLGDITESVTGDKRAQTFEDAYLEELLRDLHEYGVPAVTYMPTRNTAEQLQNLRALCAKYGFLEICGEDINQPRQAFVCKKLEDPTFSNLIDNTWALIAHENGTRSLL